MRVFSIFYVILFSHLHTISFGQWTCGDTLIDIRDGKKYATVKIGNQCWMAENLNIGIMLTGDTLPVDNGIIEKYCYGDDSINCSLFGGLYTWDEMMNYQNQAGATGICPDNWYIPSDEEIIELELFLGMDSVSAYATNAWRGTDQGTQMLAGGTSGLEILLGGARTGPNSYMLLNSFAFVYTSSEYGSNAWRRCLRSTSSQIGRYNTFPKTYALSLRCLLNDTITSATVHNNINDLTMFYCPDYNSVIIHYNFIEDYDLSISIFDIIGRIVLSTSAYCKTDRDVVKVNTDNISTGIYIVKVKYQNTYKTGKIFVY